MKQILITGCSGFIGSHLVKTLLARGFTVRGLDIKKPEFAHDRFSFHTGSFTDYSVLEKTMNGCDIVVHLASSTIPKTSNDNPEMDIKTNLIGTVRMLDLAVKKKLEKFIFISSGGTVYGVPEFLPVTETHKTDPICSYGVVKLAIEKYVHMYHALYGLEACSLRLSNPYGERQINNPGQGVVAHLCAKALAKETMEIWGDGSVVRDFLHIDDVMVAIIKALDIRCRGEAVNISYGKGASINEILTMVESKLGCVINKKYLPTRDFDVPKIYLDNQRASTFLGWSPNVTLTEGIDRMISAIKGQV